MKQFQALNVSSKFAICGVPIRVDTYKTCSFSCTYCFANCRTGAISFENNLQVGNIKAVENRLDRIFNKGKAKEGNFLDTLILNDYTWHCGGMSDPFQPVEGKYHITRDLIDVCNKYNIHILFSTKSDNLYDCNIKPELHTFQLSITNVDNRKDIEPNVPDIQSRLKLFNELKSKGFKVGVRIQPFIPNVTNLQLLEMFKEADNFTIEGLKLVPTNLAHRKYLLDLLNLKPEDFTNFGLLNLKPEIRLNLYKPFIEYLEANNIPYSIADNDLHYLGTNKCCCGDSLVHKSTTFNNTSMLQTYGKDYTKEQVIKELDKCNCTNCICNSLFTSNRQEGCRTVKEFYDKRFERKTSPFSPKFLYYEEEQ